MRFSTTVFRYRLEGSATYPPTEWVPGSYVSLRPLSLETVVRRLAASWRRNVPGVRVVAVELVGPRS